MNATEPALPLPEEGRLAGIDFGTVRIGVAITDKRQTLASPINNYTRGDAQADTRFFQQLVQQENIVGFVIGLPVHSNGNEGKLSLAARQFGKSLAELTKLPIVYFDERFTSVEAEEFLGAAEMTSKQRKARRDMLAAQIMLSAFLESRSAAAQPPQPLDD